MAAPLNLIEPGLAWTTLAALVSEPVQPVRLAPGSAIGCRLAQDLVTAAPIPAAATSVRDGWAVRAADTAGASPYNPVPLPTMSWVETGDRLPAGTDAVLDPFDVESAAPHPAALRDAIAGEGSHAEGENAPAGWTWRRQGERLRPVDLPLLAASGASTVSVRRPKVALLPLGDEFVRDPTGETLGCFVSGLIDGDGSVVRALRPVGDDPALIAAGLLAGVNDADLVLTLGRTGDGRRDHAAAGIVAAGRLVLHGLGARPGRTAGFGTVGTCPVIMLPGRVEDAFAAWLLLVRPLIRLLSAATAEPHRCVRLGRKIISTVGLAELVLLRHGSEPELAEPLATGSLSLAALAQADAVMVVPHGSEGYEQGSRVAVLDLPNPQWSSV